MFKDETCTVVVDKKKFDKKKYPSTTPKPETKYMKELQKKTEIDCSTECAWDSNCTHYAYNTVDETCTIASEDKYKEEMKTNHDHFKDRAVPPDTDFMTTLTYQSPHSCYMWTGSDREAGKTEQQVCESKGYVFTGGMNKDYPGCKTCSCCRRDALCAPGTHIKTLKDCMQAAVRLKLSVGFTRLGDIDVWEGSSADMPTGCSYREESSTAPGRLHWNTSTHEKGRDDLSPLCIQQEWKKGRMCHLAQPYTPLLKSELHSS